MPIYEYRCDGCGRKSAFLTLKPEQPPDLSCPLCQGRKLTRLLSRFATMRSEEDRLESLADPGRFSGLDESDPKSMARWMKNVGRELGEDIGDEIDAGLEGALEHEGTEQSEPET